MTFATVKNTARTIYRNLLLRVWRKWNYWQARQKLKKNESYS